MSSNKTIRYYSEEQSKYISTKIPIIMKKALLYAAEVLEPSAKEYYETLAIVINFCKKNNRKIYGGYALNNMLKSKKKEEIYDESDFPDVEFFSPTPIKDLYEICNELHEKGYKYIKGQEAQHPETYTIFVNFKNTCDITYAPSNVYNHMRTYECDGFVYQHPHLMIIDYFRMINDPLTSYWRLDRAFKRLDILQKTFPFHIMDEHIKSPKLSEKMREMLTSIKTLHIPDSKTLIICGYEAYNYYVGVSNAKISNMMVNVPFLEFISTNYVEDVLNLFTFIKSTLLDDEKSKLRHDEYFPFFQFVGFKSIITFENKPIVIIYDHNNMCIPFSKIRMKYNTSKKEIEHRIATFTYTLMMIMITAMRMRIEKNSVERKNCEIIVSNLLQVREEYFKRTKMSPLDDTPFREYQICCVGTTMTQSRKHKLKNLAKKEKGKSFMFSYDPATAKEKEPSGKFFFANTSGNLITNDKNKRINICKSIAEQKPEHESDETEEK